MSNIFDSYKKGDMEIVGVKEDGTLVLNGDETTETTSFSRASAMKEKGNLLLVKMKRTFEAIRVYTAGIELITESGKKNRPEDPKLRRLLLELYSNWYVFRRVLDVVIAHTYNNTHSALALLKEKNFESTIVLCDQAIELCPAQSYKAMYRKGQALKLLGRVEESKTCLRRAKKMKASSS